MRIFGIANGASPCPSESPPFFLRGVKRPTNRVINHTMAQPSDAAFSVNRYT